MPWTAADATRHTKKANTAKKRKLWAQIANRELRQGASEGSAIGQANAAIGRIGRKGKTVMTR